MPWVGLRCVIVVFPGHTNLLFVVAKSTDTDEMSHFASFRLDLSFCHNIQSSRVRLAPLNMFKPASDFLLTVPMRCFFSGSFMLFVFHVCLYYTDFSVPCGLVINCWKRADLSALLRVMFPCVFVTFPYGVSGVRCCT